MVYSFDERRVGSYFGEDLYEKCFTLEDINECNSIVVVGSDKIVNIDGFFETAEGKVSINSVVKWTNYPDMTVNNMSIATISFFDYDGEDDGYLFFDNTITQFNNFLSTATGGIFKVQYTKRS